jgi:DNA polymerase (family 10)
MAKPDTAAVAKMLRELAQRLELEGGNPYRARAYARAAENLSLSPEPLERLIKQGRLTEIPGIGDAIAAVITKVHETGQHAGLEAMREKVPESALAMLRIPGLKPDRVRRLYTDLGISSVEALEEAARSDKLKTLKGYGPAFQAKILQGIEMSRRPQGRHIHRAAAAIAYARAEIERLHPDWQQITPAGEYRRGCELVSTLSLVAVDPKLPSGDNSVVQSELTIHVTSRERYGIALLLATGSNQHIEALRARAAKQGCTLDQTGLHKKQRHLASKTEDDIYAALNLPFIPPELRETGSEVERAAAGELPDLVTAEDLRGVLHAHTTESDGADTLGAMAEATRQRGYAYLGLTDHSQAAHYAGGLKADEVLAQQKQIDKLNTSYGAKFHVFKGIESDILGDGSLDYPDEILQTFNLVIASVHSKFRMSEKEQTDRIVRAIENPYTTILGHVTGRQLLRRPGYDVDMERILKACAKHGVAIEINAHPWRLDMDWRWCERALALGCMFSIDPDAHATDEIDNLQWGVLMARKGGVPKERVLNALNLAQFKAHLEARKVRCKTKSSRRPTPRKRTGGSELVR